MVTRNQFLIATAIALALYYFRRSSKASASKRRALTSDSTEGDQNPTKKKVKVDMVFFRRCLKLLRICVPGVFCYETFLVAVLTSLLVARTRLSITMAETVGQNAKLLVQRNLDQFMSGVLDIGLWSIPSSVVNSAIKHVTGMLEMRFKSNLQRRLHGSFLNGFAVSKLAEGKLDTPDHRLTADVAAWCNEIAELYPSVFKPTIDVVTFLYQIGQYGGYLAPLGLVGYYFVAGNLLRAILPNFAKLTALSAQKEGDFRWIHNQLVQHAEEVAFYRGEETERRHADEAITSLVEHTAHVKYLKAFADFLDGVLVKYGATCAGYAVCSIGVFSLRGKATTSELTRVYIRSSQLYISLGQAVGKLVLLHQHITALAGYTSRVAELRETLEMIERTSAGEDGRIPNLFTNDKDSDIICRNVDVVTPTGSVLLRDFSVTLRPGEHVLLMGNNGSGKTALLRVIAGIWPCVSGTVTRPPLEKLTFVTQRTYLPQGTLRAQLIFPDTEEEFRSKGGKDQDLLELVDQMALDKVLKREGGLGALKEWHEVLSGGERQRVAFVRMLYHRPRFGILDEATSATSQDIEPQMYESALRRGITLFTISHREALKKYHTQLVLLDGKGGYELSQLLNWRGV